MVLFGFLSSLDQNCKGKIWPFFGSLNHVTSLFASDRVSSGFKGRRPIERAVFECLKGSRETKGRPYCMTLFWWISQQKLLKSRCMRVSQPCGGPGLAIERVSSGSKGRHPIEIAVLEQLKGSRKTKGRPYCEILFEQFSQQRRL